MSVWSLKKRDFPFRRSPIQIAVDREPQRWKKRRDVKFCFAPLERRVPQDGAFLSRRVPQPARSSAGTLFPRCLQSQTWPGALPAINAGLRNDGAG